MNERSEQMNYAIVSKRVEAKEVSNMPATNIKTAVHEVAENLSNSATWDDVIYEMTVRKEIEEGLADSKANRVTPTIDVLKEFGIAS